MIERTPSVALREFLAGKGHHKVDEGTIRLALDALYAVTQQNWHLVEDAIPTLGLLGRKGYRLGMISNTSDDRNVQQLIDQHGLRSYFEIILTSAGCGIRKPDALIFQLALEHFKVTAEEAAMVGDTLDADILGANRMGIYSIWISPLNEADEEGELNIQPQAVVSTLVQIPALLEALNSEVGSQEYEK
jgi:HAD superfamily hydrolase (TIGR01662 family)